MAPQTLSGTPQPLSSELPGTWKLAGGRAITLQPREPGIFRVAHGQMWATFDGPHGGPPNDQGDHVIGAGVELRLDAGQRMVVEAWSAATPAYFSWDPVPVRVSVSAPRMVRVMQPLADLRMAIVFGAGAAVRLASGLVSVGWELVRSGWERPRSMPIIRHGPAKVFPART